MNIYVIYEKNYVDFKTGMNDNISFLGAYKNRRKAVRKAKEVVRNVKADNLFIDNQIKNKQNPFKKNNSVDFYHDREVQDYVVTTIGLEETKLIA